jgi:hypothetical protein
MNMDGTSVSGGSSPLKKFGSEGSPYGGALNAAPGTLALAEDLTIIADRIVLDDFFDQIARHVKSCFKRMRVRLRGRKAKT